MALTQVKTTGLADDAVTGAKIADDTVAEANMANDAISLTELKAGTDGQIITYDASGNPTAVGPGTDGQVLTSTGAGSPPAFEALPASNNYTHPNHSGEVTSTADGAQVIADDVVDEANLKISNAGSNGQFLSKQSGDTGGLTWATVSTDPTTTSGTNNFTVADGDLVIGTAGHGISFAADGHATNMSSELLDDYEEGDFTVTLTATGGGTLGLSGNDHMKYTKIGNRVFISGSIDCNAHSSATGFLQVNGFPFTVEHDGSAANCTHIGVVYFRGGDSTPGSTGNYGDFAVRWTMGANETAAYAQAVYGGLTDSGSQNTAQYVGESTYIYFNFSYPAA